MAAGTLRFESAAGRWVVAGALAFATMPTRRRGVAVATAEEHGHPTFHCPLDAPPSVIHPERSASR